ncbi:MAG TPA: hypothetical protein DD653_00960, partial [Marinilabiliales bacterium]|nr:hypothetical protein [Marinilabiliales bacterium]
MIFADSNVLYSICYLIHVLKILLSWLIRCLFNMKHNYYITSVFTY